MGTIKRTKQSRNVIENKLKIKVIPVFPNPCRMLHRVPERYKKGQTKASARIWLAAKGLLKSKMPNKSAKQRKKNIHVMPNRKQINKVR